MADSKRNYSKSRSGQGGNRPGQSSKTKAGNSGRSNCVSVKSAEKDKGDITITVIIAVVIALFLELSNFNVLGQLGSYIKYGLFGLFGVMAYVFPVAMFLFILYLNLRKSQKTGPVVCMVIMFICLCAFTHLTSGFETGAASVINTFTISAEETSGGGITGGALAIGLSILVGRTGTYIVTIVAFLVCLIFALQLPLVELIGSLFDKGGDRENDKKSHPENMNIKEQRPERTKPRRDRDEIVYDRTDKDGNHVNITYTPSRQMSRQIRKTEAKRRKAMTMRQTSFEMKRFENKPKGVPENIGFTSLSSNNDEMSEITRRQMVSEEPVVPGKADQVITVQNVSKDETVFGNENSMSKTSAATGKSHAEDSKQEAGGSAAQKNQGTGAYTAMKGNTSIHDQIIKSKITNPQNIKPSRVADDGYKYPPLDLLDSRKNKSTSDEDTYTVKRKLGEFLRTYGINASVTGYEIGPSVTRYELKPELGTRVSKITSLADDLKLYLAVTEMRIEAPIPGRDVIGIEIPNKTKQAVLMRDLLEAEALKRNSSRIAFAAGKDISGEVKVADIAKMPHMLVAGTTGSGKSVFLNTILMTILYRAKPSEVGLIIIDPKMVEFRPYSGIPHLVHDVVTDPGQAVATLRWAVAEMTSRYTRMNMAGVRDFKSYNDKLKDGKIIEEDERIPKPMSQIVIVIDELADLMMVASKEVEGLICRLAQLARAAGIHLIVATQRPSVDVVTGLIKANIPARVALLVATGTDSRTIIDMNGAEKLLGYGDMLFYPTGYVKPVRVQGAYVSEEEVAKTIAFIKKYNSSDYFKEESQAIDSPEFSRSTGTEKADKGGLDEDIASNQYDEFFYEAGKFCIEVNKASSSNLQRKFNIGFNRAARIIDQLEEFGVVGPQNGSKPREIIMDLYDFEEKYNEM